MPNYFTRLFKYSTGSLAGTTTDTLVLWLLSSCFFESKTGINLVSPTISWICAVFVNFLVSYYFVWKDRVVKSKSTKKTFIGRLGTYYASCFVAFLIKMAILQLIVNLLVWNIVICNLMALCISGFCNYTINDNLTFKKKKR